MGDEVVGVDLGVEEVVVEGGEVGVGVGGEGSRGARHGLGRPKVVGKSDELQNDSFFLIGFICWVALSSCGDISRTGPSKKELIAHPNTCPQRRWIYSAYILDFPDGRQRWIIQCLLMMPLDGERSACP